MEIDSEFKKLEKEADAFYNSIKKVHSPALNADIIFNSDGLYHLKYNGSRKKRSKPEQRNKLAYLPEAVDLLRTSTTIQEYREVLEQVGTPDSKGYRTMIKVGYYAFYGIIQRQSGKIRLKVIVRGVPNSGNFYFKSVMPYLTEKLVNGKVVKIMAPPKISLE
jgi:hypothetical protein